MQMKAMTAIAVISMLAISACGQRPASVAPNTGPDFSSPQPATGQAGQRNQGGGGEGGSGGQNASGTGVR
jgi:Spy/CpxP family protein refolding chaperone